MVVLLRPLPMWSSSGQQGLCVRMVVLLRPLFVWHLGYRVCVSGQWSCSDPCPCGLYLGNRVCVLGRWSCLTLVRVAFGIQGLHVGMVVPLLLFCGLGHRVTS